MSENNIECYSAICEFEKKMKGSYQSWDSEYEFTKDDTIDQLKADLYIVRDDNKKLVREVNRLNNVVSGLPEDKQPKPVSEMKVWRVSVNKDFTKFENFKSYCIVAASFDDAVDMVKARNLGSIRSIDILSASCEVIL